MSADAPAVIDSASQHDTPTEQLSAGHSALLLGSIFVIAACGLVYELIAGSLSTYLLGNSVTQFSIVIGLFLSAMGLGSFLSRFVTRQLLRTFLGVEIWIGLIGGLSPLLLFFAFATIGNYTTLLVCLSIAIGTLVGLEIPLLVRILRQRVSLKRALGSALSLDYLGALAAALLFPFVLVPHLGLVRTGCLFGLLNVTVALIGIRLFRRQLRQRNRLRFSALLTGVILFVGLITSGRTTQALEDQLYDDEILFAKTTPYQRIVLTRWRDDLRLFIDGNIQFSSLDEFRYHESLVHPAMGLVDSASNVLILGGGDGMAVREILKYDSVRRIDLVDLDPAITQLFASNQLLRRLNANALNDSRVHVFNQDAQKFLERASRHYDVIVIDLPDPNNEALGKLYSRSFYRLVAKHLSPTGVFVTQATSPFFAPRAFWCIINTIRAANISTEGPSLRALPYHANVPSFGEWGFVLAALRPIAVERINLKVPTKYLSAALIPSLFVLPKDLGPRQTPVNRLDNQILVQLYEQDYGRFNR